MSSLLLPVLIVGAGPTGLNLANLLCQYGITFRLIEEKLEPIKTSNALAVQARSLEMWDSMGLADQAIQLGKKILGLTLNTSDKKIAEISFEHVNLPTQFPYILGLPQAETENLLTEHLQKQGNYVERGLTLIDLTQTADYIIADVQHANGQREKINCGWLIAADGSHSTVRKKLNLTFSGGTLPEKFIMADVIMTANFNPDYFHAFSSPQGPLVFAPMPKFTRIISTVTNDKNIKDFENPTLADFEQVIANRSKVNVQIQSTVWTSHFITHHRMIDDYCHGRIVFAGDSAHIHSPVGGQGMNTGMQDTFNLAWKLALVINGKSKSRLLDSYSVERRSVVKKVLVGTTLMTRIVTFTNPLLIGLRNNLMRFLFKYQFIQKKITFNISELGVYYSPSDIIMNQNMRGKKLLAGQRAPHPELFRGIKHTLLLFSGLNVTNERAGQITQLINFITKNHNDFFDYIVVSNNKSNFSGLDIALDLDSKLHHAYDVMEGGIFIVRPDRYIGFRSDEVSDKSIIAYLERICVC